MKLILSWLLHHANRKYHNPEFYSIKNRILAKYGQHIRYDVQFIEGKKCNSCGGTGWHTVHYRNGITAENPCFYCHGGWYKLPVWNILALVQFGKYTFHQPYKRSYSKPDNGITLINGYIEHEPSKHADFAATVLFLLYEKGYLKRLYKASYGWRVNWWLPRNWLHNLVYLSKHNWKIPYRITWAKPKTEDFSGIINELPF